jgi:hypothetical protein
MHARMTREVKVLADCKGMGGYLCGLRALASLVSSKNKKGLAECKGTKAFSRVWLLNLQ